MKKHVFMSTMIQVRNVPESLQRRLKARAAMEGISMSAYVRRLIERAVQRPSRQEVLDALRALPGIETDVSAAEILREARESRYRW
jgi:plasmid stability protein